MFTGLGFCIDLLYGFCIACYMSLGFCIDLLYGFCIACLIVVFFEFAIC